MTIAVQTLISGRVQGAYYRGWTEEQAVTRGLSGWVTNNPDGTVSALFIGPDAAVQEMLVACRYGPPAARVDAVETTVLDPVPTSAGFRVRR
ncbi:MAG: acylphosphatase [Pseudomonadota bacterium]